MATQAHHIELLAALLPIQVLHMREGGRKAEVVQAHPVDRKQQEDNILGEEGTSRGRSITWLGPVDGRYLSCGHARGGWSVASQRIMRRDPRGRGGSRQDEVPWGI
jgi:hypothetical protein